MNEQMNVALTVMNDQGEEIPLLRQDVPLDGQFTNLLNTLNRLNAVKNAQAVTFNIHPVQSNGQPSESGQDGAFWMVSFVTRRAGGALVTQDLLPFKSRALAEDVTRRLVDAFRGGRKISVSMDPQFIQKEQAQRSSAEIHQIIRPASTGFSPGA